MAKTLQTRLDDLERKATPTPTEIPCYECWPSGEIGAGEPVYLLCSGGVVDEKPENARILKRLGFDPALL